MDSPQTMDTYSSMELASGVVQQQVAFDDNLFDKQENNPEMSLQVLSNCVNLVNCTILKERRLLPEEFFKPFQVYGDMFGYMLDQTHSQAKKVLNKVNSIDVAIRRRQVYKVALVVEEVMNTHPAETFIWSFAYGEGVTAEIGYHGNKSSFNVDYRDMPTTCKQFCKLFSDLNRILAGLGPMPLGMIPSLRVAYKGDPEFSVGFQPVDEFVSVEEIGIGTVAFPYNHKFHMSYASEFVTVSPSHSRQSPDMERMSVDEGISYDAPITSPVEVPRHETPEIREPREERHDSPVFEDRHIDDDLMSGVTTHCQPLASPVNVLPSEEKEYVPMDDTEIGGLYGNLEESCDQIVELNEKSSERSPELIAALKIPTGRSSSAKKQKKIESSAKKSVKRKKTPEKQEKNTDPVQKQERKTEKSSEQKKKSARRLEVPPVEPPVVNKYGRMPSLLGLSFAENDEQTDQKTAQRYGRVSNFRLNAEMGANAEVVLDEPPMRSKEPERVEKVDETTPKAAPTFGRMLAVKNLFDSQPTRYGMGPPLRIDENQA